MFTTILFSKKLKYIGYVILFIMVAIPIGIVFNNLYTSVLHLTGGETKDEKIQRLEHNQQVYEDSIKSIQQEQVIEAKKQHIITEIQVTTIKDKVIRDSFKDDVKKTVATKVAKIQHKQQSTKAEEKQPPPITEVHDEELYDEVGTAFMDGMENIYLETIKDYPE